MAMDGYRWLQMAINAIDGYRAYRISKFVQQMSHDCEAWPIDLRDSRHQPGYLADLADLADIALRPVEPQLHTEPCCEAAACCSFACHSAEMVFADEVKGNITAERFSYNWQGALFPSFLEKGNEFRHDVCFISIQILLRMYKVKQSLIPTGFQNSAHQVVRLNPIRSSAQIGQGSHLSQLPKARDNAGRVVLAGTLVAAVDDLVFGMFGGTCKSLCVYIRT